MSFFDRYADLCEQHDPPYDPCGRQIAQILDINNSTVTNWKKKQTTPKGDTVRAIADLFGVSTDYLLERTDDQTDFTKQTRLSAKERVFLRMIRKMDSESQHDLLRLCRVILSDQDERRKQSPVVTA